MLLRRDADLRVFLDPAFASTESWPRGTAMNETLTGDMAPRVPKGSTTIYSESVVRIEKCESHPHIMNYLVIDAVKPTKYGNIERVKP